MRSVYLQLAVVQIASHIYRGLDNIRIPSTRPSLKSTDQRTHQIAPIPAQIKQKAPELLVLSALLSLATVFPSPFVYAGLLRGIYWSTHMAFAKLFYNIPRSNANYEGFPPCSPPMLLRAFFSGFCLLVLWESSNILFSALLAQEPIKKDQPLSAESKDPNGTLLSGLKAKKDTVKTFALWELVYISQKLPDRRKAIFADIERSGGPTWTQMLQASLSVVKAIEDRVKASQAPAQTAQVTRDSTAPYPSIQSLPHIAPDVKSSDSIFASSPPPQTKGEKLQSTVEPLVRSLGQSPHWTPSAKERVKGLLEYPGKKSTELTDASRTTSNPSFLPGPLQYYAKAFLRSHAGYPFRHTFPRVLSSIILASPNAQTAQIVDAVESITRMLVASLSEDLYGKAQSTVPETVRTFTSTIKAIEDLFDTMTPHWTDVEYETKGARVGEEVEVVLERLKGGLDELLGAFQLYLREVGLSDADFKAAKEAVRRKERKRPVAQSQPQVSSNEKPNNENIQKALPPKNGDKRSSAGGERPPRKRLEERDRGKDLEFLTALPPQQEKEKGKTDEGQKSKKALPPPEKEHEGPFAFVQRKDIHREIEQVRR